nr:1-deoxy-D-xylulose-5-phosphate synthase [FCB group bacterium]
EGHAVTFAAGLAAQGFIPMVAIYSTFLQRAYDEIIHDAALQNLKVIFAIDRAGIVGEDGPTHHGCFDLSYMRHIPNMTVMVPRDESQLRDMLYTAVYHIEGPSAIRYPRATGAGVPLRDDFKALPIGKGEILWEGEDAAVLAVGPVVHECLDALGKLSSKSIQAALADMKFVKPLDLELLYNIASTHRFIITVEENALEGGFGSLILEKLTGMDIECKTLRIGIPDKFIEQGTRKQLLKYLGLTSDGIYDAVYKFLMKEKAVY